VVCGTPGKISLESSGDGLKDGERGRNRTYNLLMERITLIFDLAEAGEAVFEGVL